MAEQTYTMTDMNEDVLDPNSERISAIKNLVVCLFDDYCLVARSQEKFITLNEDFVVELFSSYGVRFWSGNAVILSISANPSLTKVEFDFDGTEDELWILTGAFCELLQAICNKYAVELKTIEKTSAEVISALAKKYHRK